MPAIVTDKFRISNANSFIEDVGVNNYFIGIGRELPWPAGDATPELPVDTVLYANKVWNDLFGMKKVIPANVSLVTPRYTWTNGTVYAQYDSNDAELNLKSFFVHIPQVDGSIDIYKCISNNGGVSSTVQPSANTPTGLPFSTSDGYIWFYMGGVSAGNVALYGTPQHVPISTITVADGSKQYQVQQDAIPGAIFTIHVVAGGTNGTNGSAIPVTIVGDGAGATATANVVGGVVQSVTMTAVGANYSFATATLPTGSGVSLNVAVAPPGGHGCDAVNELGAFYAMVYAQLQYDENSTLTVNNAYRRVSLFKNPLLFGTTTVAISINYRQTHRYNMTGISGTFDLNEEVIQTGSGASGYIVDIDTTNNIMFLNMISGTFTTGASTVTGQTSGATCDFGAALAGDNPNLQPYSGTVLFVENRKPIQRASDQIEDVRIIVEF